MAFTTFGHTYQRLSPAKILFSFYLIAIIISTGILSFPFIYQSDIKPPFIDRLFIAVSAVSVTGLTPVDLSETYHPIGFFFIALILQIGALGVMAFGTFFWLIVGKKIGMKERTLIMADQNQLNISGSIRIIKHLFIIFLSIEGLSILILGTYYLKFYSWKQAYFHGFFTTISAISNGGFDLTGSSLIPFQTDYFVMGVHMLLIVFGSIGFPVLFEVKQYIFLKKRDRQFYRFSLFTKFTSIVYFVLIVVGMLMIYFLDRGNYFSDQPLSSSLFTALFLSITTRSGGLSTLNLSELQDPNLLWMAFLMFIGGSPSSAGGGIRTTTFALLIILIMNYARGNQEIRIFRRGIYLEDLIKAVVITIFAISLVSLSTFLIFLIEKGELLQIIFEVTSAFGTVGLSLGITDQLTTGSKMILMILMFIGRVGILTVLLLFKREQPSGKFQYPKEKMIIGS